MFNSFVTLMDPGAVALWALEITPDSIGKTEKFSRNYKLLTVDKMTFKSTRNT